MPDLSHPAVNTPIPDPISTTELEQLCLYLRRNQQADGVILVLLHDGRAETIALLPNGGMSLGEHLRTLGEEVESGSGIPVGFDHSV